MDEFCSQEYRDQQKLTFPDQGNREREPGTFSFSIAIGCDRWEKSRSGQCFGVLRVSAFLRSKVDGHVGRSSNRAQSVRILPHALESVARRSLATRCWGKAPRRRLMPHQGERFGS